MGDCDMANLREMQDKIATLEAHEHAKNASPGSIMANELATARWQYVVSLLEILARVSVVRPDGDLVRLPVEPKEGSAPAVGKLSKRLT
jgi:hypothetical protein